ncbi:hypothetical protein PG995_010149 [Apiospora arundinis]
MTTESVTTDIMTDIMLSALSSPEPDSQRGRKRRRSPPAIYQDYHHAQPVGRICHLPRSFTSPLHFAPGYLKDGVAAEERLALAHPEKTTEGTSAESPPEPEPF